MTKSEAPGPRGLPVLGNTHQWARDPCSFREHCTDEYGSVVNYERLGWDTYLLTDPDDIKQVIEDRETFKKHGDSGELLKDVLGEGLLTSTGDLWETQREAIQPAFYMDHIRNYAEIMVDQADVTSERLTDGTVTNIQDEMARSALSILVKCMFGENIDPAARGIYEAVDAFEEPYKPSKQPITLFAPDWAPIPFLRRAKRAENHIDEQIHDIIEQRRRNRADGSSERDDLLAMMLDSGTGMEDQQIRDEMMTFLLAGHQTTALTLTYIWDLLSRNPEIERRLHAELDGLDGRPSIEDVFEFEYVEAVVKEAMRLYPPAHEIRREPTTDVEIGGYAVPEGSLIVLSTWVQQRDDRFWDDPEQFRPDRFLDEGRDRPKYAYFPFGGGSRRCIGHQFAMTEVQLVLATIARKWKFDREYDDLELSATLTLRPTMDIDMTAHRR